MQNRYLKNSQLTLWSDSQTTNRQTKYVGRTISLTEKKQRPTKENVWERSPWSKERRRNRKFENQMGTIG